MYSYVSNHVQGLLVGWNDGTADTDEDFARTLEAAKVLDQHCVSLGKPLATVLVVEAGATRPDALWRKRISDQIETYKAPHLFALVTTSTVMRGVLTAIEWFNRSPQRYATRSHATFDESVRWIEQRRGERLDELHKMWGELRAQRSQPATTAASR